VKNELFLAENQSDIMIQSAYRKILR